MLWILANLGTIYAIASGVVSTAAVVAAITPTPKDDSAVAAARKVLDFFAFNFGNARNAAPVPPPLPQD